MTFHTGESSERPLQGRFVLEAKSIWLGRAIMAMCVLLMASGVFAIGTLPPADGYVGSQMCSGCHAQKYQKWQTTLHSSIYRAPTAENLISPFNGVVRIADPGHGIPEVEITLDDNGGSGPFTATFGGQTYEVARMHGGRALERNEDAMFPELAGHARYIGKQRYHTKIGDVYYILPMQWNPIPDLDGNNGGWVAYHLNDWFDAEGNLALVVSQNEERRCAGCHQTGVQAGYDAASERWVYGAIEENIACEACHGPGQAHISASTSEERRATMINPETDLADIDRQNDICGQCHARGSSKEVINGKTLGYPYANGRGFRPGDDVMQDLYNDGGGYWGGGLSKQHHQQAFDYKLSKHAGSMTCWSCHNPHGSENEHDLVQTARDNSLCSTCHPSEGGAIAAHSQHPESNPDSPRCVDCHMSAAQKSAVNYDIHQHTFEVLTPADTLAFARPNACAMCHRSYDGIEDGSISAWDEESDLVINAWLDTQYRTLFGGSFVETWAEYTE